MNVDAAFEHLGLVVGASPNAIRAAYRARSFKAHPDHAGGSAEAMTKLTAAREIAVAYAIAEKCPECSGTGRRVLSAGWESHYVDCTICDASGKKHGPAPGTRV